MLNNEKLYPQFVCPNCRAVTDLEADIEDIQEAWETGEDESPGVEEASAEDFANAAGSAVADGSMDLSEDINGTAQHSMPGQSNPIPLSVTGVATRALARRANDGEGGDNTTGSIGDSLSAAQTPSNALRDPRTANETLEGVVTPRNEAGPFVFDGTVGRRASGFRNNIPIEGAINAGLV